MEIAKIAVMSTAHLTEEAVKNLQDWAYEENVIRDEGMSRDVWDRIKGIMVSTSMDEMASVDRELSLCACVDHVTALHGPSTVSFILFDRDADTVDGLPVYDW